MDSFDIFMSVDNGERWNGLIYCKTREAQYDGQKNTN